MTAGAAPVELPPGDVARYHAAVIELADETRRIAMPMLARGFATETKADASPVTDVDRDEGHVFDALARRFPNHRIFRAAYAHTAVITGAADVMVDAHNHIWDVAPSQVLIEEAGGAYAVVRDFESPTGRLLSAVFGKRGLVNRLVSVFADPSVGE